MSTFDGFLKDPALHFIAIDCFKPVTYKCSHFMLSHVHYDHREGLNNQFFSLLNQSTDKFLYCAPITAHILTKIVSIPTDKIITLDINKPFVIRRDDLDTDLIVTALAAGHCPGSAMFLFEYNNKRSLYTGDLRMSSADLKKMKNPICNHDGSVIRIQDLYLDTTFAFPSNFDDFPSREDCKEFILDRFENWLQSSEKQNQQLKIVLNLPSKCGVEFLYLAFYNKFKKPVSVHDYSYYSQVEEMSNCVVPFDLNDDRWFIHACIRKDLCPARDLKGVDLKFVKPCVQAFKFAKVEEIGIDEKYKVPFLDLRYEFKFLYSSHCSLNELRDIVAYLKPERIFPNVKNDSMTHDPPFSIKEMIESLRSRGASKLRLTRNCSPARSPIKCNGSLKSSPGLNCQKRVLAKTVSKRTREEQEAHYDSIMKKLKFKF